MPSLPELQRRFAGRLLDTADDGDARMAVYRNTVRANYRNALGATYRVVRELTGAPFFNAAVDAYVLVHPSAGGDLNVYGKTFGDFLAAYPHAQPLRYLPDVARLEWAIDEAHRAADAGGTAEELLAALAAVPGDRVAFHHFALAPSCRLLRSAYPVLRIWQMHQGDAGAVGPVRFDAGTEYLLVQRDAAGVGVERLSAGDFALLAALESGADLAHALAAALDADAMFDLGSALHTYIAERTLVAVHAPH